MNTQSIGLNESAVRPRTSICAAIRFSKNNVVQHYGVEGQKWGVITKEYEPVAIDHRRMRSPKSYSIRRIAKSTTRGVLPITKEPRTRADYRGEARIIRERNEQARKKALIIGASAVGLIAAYGAIRYVKVQKAKAYAGLLNRFLKQNPTANLTTESGRALLQSGSIKARINSRSLVNAKSTNRYLKSIGKTVKTKDALRLYKARNSISRLSNVSVNPTGSKVLETMKKIDRQRLARLLSAKRRI